MAHTAVILIRVLLGLTLGLAGLITLGQGFIMIANENFPTLGLMLAMLAGLAVGSALLFGSWRLLSATLRIPSQSTS